MRDDGLVGSDLHPSCYDVFVGEGREFPDSIEAATYPIDATRGGVVSEIPPAITRCSGLLGREVSALRGGDLKEQLEVGDLLWHCQLALWMIADGPPV